MRITYFALVDASAVLWVTVIRLRLAFIAGLLVYRAWFFAALVLVYGFLLAI